MSGGKPLTNPYARDRPLVPLINNRMGRQSQQRVSNTKRAYQLASFKAPKRKKGEQGTLFGGVAFQPEKDCQVCKAQAMAKLVSSYRIPKRPHHVLCMKNTKTKGKGILSEQALVMKQEEERLKNLFEMPLQPEEKGSAKYLTKEAGEAFFSPKPIKMILL